jgi:curli production assembly/transport component CsgG
MRQLVRQLLLLSLLGTLVSSCATHSGYISPCMTNPDGDYKDLVTIIRKAECFSGSAILEKPVTKEIQELPLPARTPVVAIYKFEDLTGQRKSRDGIADFSSAMTQAPEAYLIRALKSSGFFKVVERKGLDHLTKERQLIRSTRERFDEEDKQLPLLYAGIIIEGGIVDYNTNVLTGGAGARYLGIGTSKQYREDNVVVSMRLVSVSTGEILLDILTSKAILSVGVSNDYFRFTTANDLVEVESGNSMNEPKFIALQAAIETSVVELVRKGQEKGYWKYYLGE